jgi:phosphoglycolate phosphatase-like HAD superfamily hydrolase
MERHFLALAGAGRLTLAEQRAWLLETVEIYARYDLKLSAALAALDDVKTRPGVWKCLQSLKYHGIPAAIVSYNSANLIRHVLERNGLTKLVHHVFALELATDLDGRIVGCRPETAVVPASKGHRSRLFASWYGVPTDRIFGVGDTRGDYRIGHLKRNRLGVGDTREYLDHIRPVMGDVVNVGLSFDPVTDWLRQRIFG